MFKKLFPCHFNEPKCEDNFFGCRCGKGGDSEPPPRVDPSEEARAQVNAQIESIPRAAQLNYDVLNNPNYGLLPTTQLYEQVRQQAFPNENAVRNQLVQNVLGQLQSPTGATPRQAAVTANRALATNELTRTLRERDNLGGTLYGGRGAARESTAVGQLQNQFAESDINRDERNRLNNSSLALSILQALFPQSSVQQPNYINPVADPNTQYSNNVQQRSGDMNFQLQQQANQNALYGAMFEGLGKLGGGLAMGGL